MPSSHLLSRTLVKSLCVQQEPRSDNQTCNWKFLICGRLNDMVPAKFNCFYSLRPTYLFISKTEPLVFGASNQVLGTLQKMSSSCLLVTCSIHQCSKPESMDNTLPNGGLLSKHIFLAPSATFNVPNV